MSDILMTNEQKLDEMHEILIRQEKRRRSAMWFKFFKWLIIAGVVYFTYTHPDAIMGRLTEVLKPMVLSTASGIINDVKKQMNISDNPQINEYLNKIKNK